MVVVVVESWVKVVGARVVVVLMETLVFVQVQCWGERGAGVVMVVEHDDLFFLPDLGGSATLVTSKCCDWARMPVFFLSSRMKLNWYSLLLGRSAAVGLYRNQSTTGSNKTHPFSMPQTGLMV